MLLALICYRNCFSYDLELQETWSCSKPDAKMTFFIIYSIRQLFHKPTHLYSQVGQNLFGIRLMKNISHMLYIMPLHLYNKDRVHPSSPSPPPSFRELGTGYSQKLNVSCALSNPLGALLNQALGYHQSLPAALYNHLFILHRPQSHLPFSFASLYILLVFYPSL